VELFCSVLWMVVELAKFIFSHSRRWGYFLKGWIWRKYQFKGTELNLNVNSTVRDRGRSSSNKWQSVHLRLLQRRRSLEDRATVLASVSSTLSFQRQLPVFLLRSTTREGQSHVRQRRAGSHQRQVSSADKIRKRISMLCLLHIPRATVNDASARRVLCLIGCFMTGCQIWDFEWTWTIFSIRCVSHVREHVIVNIITTTTATTMINNAISIWSVYQCDE